MSMTSKSTYYIGFIGTFRWHEPQHNHGGIENGSVQESSPWITYLSDVSFQWLEYHQDMSRTIKIFLVKLGAIKELSPCLSKSRCQMRLCASALWWVDG